jgi:two-component SAPR family response regulator
VMISERAATLFFFIVSESTGAVRSEDSFYHLWKQFRDDF